MTNTESTYSFLNSVDFHPKEPIFCVTHTQNNMIRIYKIDNDMQPILIQTIEGHGARLKEPQHAVFSPDGQSLVVANWTDRSLNVYRRQNGGLFERTPIHTIFFPKALNRSKPHGIAFSPSGQYLAIACGATSDFKNGLALFKKNRRCLEHADVLTHDQLLGIPKGICFSPDGTCLLVTFCEPCCLAIFHLDGGKIDPLPRQIIQGAHTGLSRPEDIKLMPGGAYCAVSNSDRDTLTFYPFDQRTNTITDTPCWTLANPEARLTFPHGLAFSSDGSYLAVTQFGHIEMTPSGKIVWKHGFPPQEGAIHLYRGSHAGGFLAP
jgi:WD40 repeat protein